MLVYMDITGASNFKETIGDFPLAWESLAYCKAGENSHPWPYRIYSAGFIYSEINLLHLFFRRF